MMKRSKDCLPCPAGQYCSGVGKTKPTGLCDAGFYCKGAAYTSVRYYHLGFYSIWSITINY